jgi:hypothetical protein
MFEWKYVGGGQWTLASVEGQSRTRDVGVGVPAKVMGERNRIEFNFIWQTCINY